MPEVVVATPDANGKPRNWAEVFPIWKQNVETSEWRIINEILGDGIAMNNRMGGLTLDELKARIRKNIDEHFKTYFDETLAELQALPNPEMNGMGIALKNPEELTEDHKKILEKRNTAWASYGKWLYYLDAVFENVDSVYRQWK